MIGVVISKAYCRERKMAGNKDIAKRRQIRAMETKRDKLIEASAKARVSLAETRAALKALRSRR